MELHDFIFCEDIRNEINNKVSLMGVFNDRLIVRSHHAQPLKWPVQIRLCTFLRLKFSGKEERPATFTFEYLVNGRALGPMHGQLKIDPSQDFSHISILGQGIPLEKGLMGFRLSLELNGEMVNEFTHSDALKILEVSSADVAPAH